MVHLRRWWFAGGSSVVAAQRGDKAKERSEKALIFLSILVFSHFLILILDYRDVHAGHHRPQYVLAIYHRHPRLGQPYPRNYRRPWDVPVLM